MEARKRYEQLKTLREPFLRRAREAATLTIPSMLPPEGFTGTMTLPTPHQGLGARGLRNISSRLLMSLLPPNSPFFRLTLDETVLETAGLDAKATLQVEESMVRMEQSIMKEVEVKALRIPIFESIKHLVCGGNALFHIDEGVTSRMFTLDQYVVNRDGKGRVLEIIVKEMVPEDSLPISIQGLAMANQFSSGVGNGPAPSSPDGEKMQEMFTCIRLMPDMENFHVHQEVLGKMIPDSDGQFPVSSSPWLPLRFHRISGESYGRGLVEEYLGDLVSLESLTQSAIEAAAAASKVLFLVDPGSVTKAETLAKAPNGSYRSGRADDVTTLKVDKFSDLQITGTVMSTIQDRLSFAFLLNSAIQRSGERVTAEEIRFMASELEVALGGSYSVLALEMQLPIVEAMRRIMTKEERLPDMPKDLVRPSVITGLEALGRGNDLTRLSQFLETSTRTLGPDAVAGLTQTREIMVQLANASGLDASSIIKTEEQLQQEQQQAQAQQAAQDFGPQALDLAANQAQAPQQ